MVKYIVQREKEPIKSHRAVARGRLNLDRGGMLRLCPKCVPC